MGPVGNLLCVSLAIAVIVWWLRRDRSKRWGPLARHRPHWPLGRQPGKRLRVQTEDALKHIHSHGQAGWSPTLESLAGAVQVSPDAAAALADRMERQQLVQCGPLGVELTEKGRRYALQVIRTHRLWEQYLAEETGVSQAEWHAHADQMEHLLTPAQVEALARRMGNPAYDPHGDPIPTAGGRVGEPPGKPLSLFEPPTVVRVVHIEDEPEALYRQLLPLDLQPGMILRIVEHTPSGIVVDTGLASQCIPVLAAGNVSVQLDERSDRPVPLGRRLSEFPLGAAAVVTDLGPSCRGVERRRLLDLGLVPGTRVVAELASPAGDPIAYRIRGALIALRRDQARMIFVSSDTTEDEDDKRDDWTGETDHVRPNQP